MHDRAFDALTLDIPDVGTRFVSFSRMGNSGKVRATFTLDASTLSVDTWYSVSVGIYEKGVKRFRVSAFDLASRTGTPSTPKPTPSTLNPQPSTLNPQPYTLNPQPYTLHPTPSTLNPQPSTFTLSLNPKAGAWLEARDTVTTLNPKTPSTLNPNPKTPQTLNPNPEDPYTLNPTPSTLNPEP